MAFLVCFDSNGDISSIKDGDELEYNHKDSPESMNEVEICPPNFDTTPLAGNCYTFNDDGTGVDAKVRGAFLCYDGPKKVFHGPGCHCVRRLGPNLIIYHC